MRHAPLLTLALLAPPQPPAQDPAAPLRDCWTEALEAARTGAGPRAVRALERAVELGLDDWQALHTDRALDPIRLEPGLRALLAGCSTASQLRLTRPERPGAPLDLELQVCGAGGEPLAGARVYLYHTDARGSYGPGTSRVPGIFGYLCTDAAGCVRVRTVRPASYPDSAVAQHVHFTVRAEGHVPLTSEVLFEGDPLLTAEGRRDGIAIALTRDAGGRVARGRCEVQLRSAR